MLQLIICLCSAVLLLSKQSKAEATLTLSTNATIVQVGQPLTVTCQVHNLNLSQLSHTWFDLYLHVNSSYKAKYQVDVLLVNDVGSSHPVASTRFFSYNDSTYEISSSAYNATYYQFNIMFKKAVVEELSCRFWDPYPPPIDIYSNRINVTSVTSNPTQQPTTPTTPKPSLPTTTNLPATTPSITFSTSVRKIKTGKPFTATCTIFNFYLTNRNYSIKFYKQKAGLIATYEINTTNTQKPLLSAEKLANTVVHHGARFTYPTFDLLITETQGDRNNYWCALEDSKQTYTSNRWPGTPVVDFDSKAIDNVRVGICSITSFDPTGKIYKIRFYSQMGADIENLMATFTVKPNEPAEFLVEHVPSEFSNITHGNSVAFPNFEITTKSNHFYGHWWCTLAVGVEKQDGYQEYRSNFKMF